MNSFNKTQRTIILIAIILVAGIIGYYVYGNNTTTQSFSTNDNNFLNEVENKTEEKGKIIVHITGAVNKEGIVTLEENSRVSDAVQAAGGLKEDADINKINLAYILEDGIKIKIPSVNDDKEIQNNTDDAEIVEYMPESNVKSENGTININKASQTELETLPGIGPSTALQIINYRNENGKFSSVEDLKKVSGIGDSKFEKIKELITVK